jgi:hypothetical protein
MYKNESQRVKKMQKMLRRKRVGVNLILRTVSVGLTEIPQLNLGEFLPILKIMAIMTSFEELFFLIS